MKKPLFISRRFHFVLDAFDCELKLLSDPDFLMDILIKTAKLLDMKILKGPEIAEGIPENPGYTLFAIIDFSHISIHTFTDQKEFCLDIFSCKTFDFDKLEKFIIKSFSLTKKNLFKSIVRYDQLEMERDKKSFSAEKFLSEYYGDFSLENKSVLDFYKENYKNIEKDVSILAFSGTPAISHMFSALEKSKNLIPAFCTNSNLDFIKNENFQNFWEKHLEFLSLENLEIKQIISNAIYLNPAIENAQHIGKYDFIQSDFCLETNTDDISEFLRSLFFIHKYLKKNGRFFMVALEGAKAINVGGKYFPVVYLDKDLINNYLEEAGFLIEKIEKINCDKPEKTKFHGLLLISAKKK